MQLGFFTMPMHPPGRNVTETLKEDRAAILLADRLGYREAFIGEHTTDRCETIASCLAFIASLASETTQIKLGSGTVNLPNNHPAQVAATVAMVDHLFLLLPVLIFLLYLLHLHLSLLFWEYPLLKCYLCY